MTATGIIDEEGKIKCGYCDYVDRYPKLTTIKVRVPAGSWRSSHTKEIRVYVCPGCGAIHTEIMKSISKNIEADMTNPFDGAGVLWTMPAEIVKMGEAYSVCTGTHINLLITRESVKTFYTWDHAHPMTTRVEYYNLTPIRLEVVTFIGGFIVSFVDGTLSLCSLRRR